MTYKYFSDMRDFAIQTALYINKVGFTFENFLYVYKTFISYFSSLIPMLFIYTGIYIKQRNGTPLKKIIKIFSFSIIIFGTAILISIAL
jgi:DMSO/TMAO reductase YedYZ heme-binding membrane subunit